jgi:hypothetical protein
MRRRECEERRAVVIVVRAVGGMVSEVEKRWEKAYVPEECAGFDGGPLSGKRVV